MLWWAFILAILSNVRNSRSQMVFKIRGFRNYANFTGKHLCWSFFLIKGLYYRDSNTGASCEICETFKKTFFYGTPSVAASVFWQYCQI